MAAERSDDLLRCPLQQVIALADIVKLKILDEQVMHAAHRCRDNGDAVMACVDVHEIGLQRRDHEVADANARTTGDVSNSVATGGEPDMVQKVGFSSD